MDITFKIDGYLVSVNFKKHIVRLRAGYDLREIMKNHPGTMDRLAEMILAEYETVFKEELHVSRASLVAEIAGHVYAYRFFLWMRKVVAGNWLRRLSYRVCKIDCGEKKYDTNRWFWDFVSYFK